MLCMCTPITEATECTMLHSLKCLCIVVKVQLELVVQLHHTFVHACTVQQYCMVMQRCMLQAAHRSGMSVEQQIATDFKQTEQCLVRLDACQRKIIACQTTIEQYRASEMDAQAELADLTNLQSEKVDLMESLTELLRTFKLVLHGNL